MSGTGRLKVIVHSRRVPTRTIPVGRSAGLPLGIRTRPYITQAVLYEDALEGAHLRAIEEARRVSCDLGLELEVVDLAKLSPLGRLLDGLIRGFAASPSIEISPGQAIAPGSGADARPALLGQRGGRKPLPNLCKSFDGEAF